MRNIALRTGLTLRQKQNAANIILPNQSVGPAQLAPNVATIQPGMGIDYYGGTIGAGYLGCDGSAVSRTLYATLFAAIGTTHGAGDGSTTFNIPDSRGRASMGAGTGPSLTARTLGQTPGEETHVLSVAEMPSHNHGDYGHGHADAGHGHSGPNLAADGNVQAGSDGRHMGDVTGISTGYANIQAGYANISYTGSNSAHNNVQPSLVVTKLIKY